MRNTEIKLGDRSYEIVIASGLLDGIGELIKKHAKSDRVFIVTDENVDALYGKRLASTLQNAGFNANKQVLTPGESSKSFSEVKLLCKSFSEAVLDRSSLVIAFGGGVVGDLAGFAASIYLRGIQFIQVPTTLLSCCDSSVGGKTGINFNGIKNSVGSFYQPQAVFIDPTLLKTLPEREMFSGLAEVLKTGLIGCSSLFDKTIEKFSTLMSCDSPNIIEEIIFDSVEIKAVVVSQDEKESGLRRILNFGHTIGHGIEAESRGSILHGEAVFAGMIAALHISQSKDILTSGTFSDLLEKMRSISPILNLSKIDFATILPIIKKDKKSVANSINFVLLEDIGSSVISNNVTENEIQEAFEFISDFFRQEHLNE